jgi:hypothetical protein
MEVILCRMLFMVVIRFIKGGLWVCDGGFNRLEEGDG